MFPNVGPSGCLGIRHCHPVGPIASLQPDLGLDFDRYSLPNKPGRIAKFASGWEGMSNGCYENGNMALPKDWWAGGDLKWISREHVEMLR